MGLRAGRGRRRGHDRAPRGGLGRPIAPAIRPRNARPGASLRRGPSLGRRARSQMRASTHAHRLPTPLLQRTAIKPGVSSVPRSACHRGARVDVGLTCTSTTKDADCHAAGTIDLRIEQGATPRRSWSRIVQPAARHRGAHQPSARTFRRAAPTRITAAVTRRRAEPATKPITAIVRPIAAATSSGRTSDHRLTA